jgi:hypothetical protein
VYPIKSFKGNMKEALLDGKGVMTFANGDVYEGDFVEGIRKGKGIYKSATKEFDGEWDDDQLHGKVKITFKDD